MPHITVKLYPGRSEQQKTQLANKIAQSVVEIAECEERSVSVAFEEVEPGDWAKVVYKPDILDGKGIIYKKPGYNPFSSEKAEKENIPNLAEYISEALKVAEKEDTSGLFNAMSWLDLMLEDAPESFDNFFNTPWNELSIVEQEKRVSEVRKFL